MSRPRQDIELEWHELLQPSSETCMRRPHVTVQEAQACFSITAQLWRIVSHGPSKDVDVIVNSCKRHLRLTRKAEVQTVPADAFACTCI